MAMTDAEVGRFVDQCIADAIRRGDLDARIRHVIEQAWAERAAAVAPSFGEVERRASVDYWDTRRRLDALLPGWERRHSLATAVEAIVKTMVQWAGGPDQIVAELERVAAETTTKPRLDLDPGDQHGT